MAPTLLVLAAGMGSRYGGLKQIDPVGPSGETLLDYAVFDAMRAGFWQGRVCHPQGVRGRIPVVRDREVLRSHPVRLRLPVAGRRARGLRRPGRPGKGRGARATRCGARAGRWTDRSRRSTRTTSTGRAPSRASRRSSGARRGRGSRSWDSASPTRFRRPGPCPAASAARGGGVLVSIAEEHAISRARRGAGAALLGARRSSR